AESDDDRSAGRRVDDDAEIAAESGDEGAHGPANGETRADAVSEEHGADAGDDEIAENEKDAGDGNRRSHDEAEGSVKEEIPEAHVETEGFGFFMVHGNEQKLFAEDVVESADGSVKKCGFLHVGPGDSEDVADEHVFEVLGFTCGFAHKKDG